MRYAGLQARVYGTVHVKALVSFGDLHILVRLIGRDRREDA
jgi:hypothetical protein